MTVTEINQKKQARKALLDKAGAILNKAKAEKRNAVSEPEMREFDSLHAQAGTLKAEITQAEEIRWSNQLTNDPRTAGREDTVTQTTGKSKISSNDSIAVRTWLAGGEGALTTEQRSVLTAANNVAGEEYRALSAATGSAGGYIVPQSFSPTFDIALKSYGGIIAAADYIDTDDGRVLPYPTVNDTGNSAAIATEGTAVVDNVDVSFGLVNYGAREFSSDMIRVPVTLLQDAAYDVENMLSGLMRNRIGRKLNTDCTTGTTGLLSSTTLGVTTASSTAFTYLELLALLHSVDPAYRDAGDPALGTGWMFNDATFKALRGLRFATVFMGRRGCSTGTSRRRCARPSTTGWRRSGWIGNRGCARRS